MLPLSLQAQRRAIVPRPPRWTAAFGREAPLEVDLGCGRGDYTLARALARPELNLVALESRIKWVRRLRELCRRRGVENLRAIRCDVTADLRVLFGPGSVTGFSIHHPDPWWKKRHRKRRLIQSSFVQELARLLRPGGWVFLQTDVEDMADEVSSVFASLPAFVPLDGERWKAEELLGLRSHRERRCMQLGIPIRRMAWRLTGAPPP